MTSAPITVALSLTQPWAWVVVHGPKRIENRVWPLPKNMIGRRFAIHAAKSWDQEAYDDLLEEAYGRIELPDGRGAFTSGAFTSGAIIGVATLDRCVALTGGLIPKQVELDQVAPDQQKWFFGPYGFVLSDVVALREPIPCKGSLSFWSLGSELQPLLEARLRLEDACWRRGAQS